MSEVSLVPHTPPRTSPSHSHTIITLSPIDSCLVANVDSIAVGLTVGDSDNRVAQLIAELRNTPSNLFLPGDPPGPATGPSRTLLEHVAVVVTDAGEQARMFNTSRNQQQRIIENAREAGIRLAAGGGKRGGCSVSCARADHGGHCLTRYVYHQGFSTTNTG